MLTHVTHSTSRRSIIIYAVPHVVIDPDGVELLAIGAEGDQEIYLLMDDLDTGMEVSVVDYFEERQHHLANSFGEWLYQACETARAQYSDKAWRDALDGSPPFTPEELDIIRRRKDFVWRFLGVVDGRLLRFEITNKSDGMMPYLSIGIRTRDHRMLGAVWLPIAKLAPGETVLIEKECYSDVSSADELEAYDLLDPTPDTRYRYWELRDESPRNDSSADSDSSLDAPN